MVCSHSEMNESSLQCGRARSNSEPVPRQRRSSIVLTPAVLNEYARGNEDAAMFKRQYEQAYYNVYGSHLPQNNGTATDMTIPWSDQTVYSRYSSDPRLNAMGFFDVQRKSSSRCSWICFHNVCSSCREPNPENSQGNHSWKLWSVICESRTGLMGELCRLWNWEWPELLFRTMFQFEIFKLKWTED